MAGWLALETGCLDNIFSKLKTIHSVIEVNVHLKVKILRINTIDYINRFLF